MHEGWTLNGTQELARGRNPRPPPMEIYLQWVSEAWDSLSRELIRESFKTCSVTGALDGSKDDLLHSFKPHSPIAEGQF